ncbi:hypothetical protein DL96DRAFT_208402 [Flagelloscypha sp. PMI_526]|nr:hypothetical protein DL96DRAFT_208402 [Flagelloscypha sp. PMI_526]
MYPFALVTILAIFIPSILALPSSSRANDLKTWSLAQANRASAKAHLYSPPLPRFGEDYSMSDPLKQLISARANMLSRVGPPPPGVSPIHAQPDPTPPIPGKSAAVPVPSEIVQHHKQKNSNGGKITRKGKDWRGRVNGKRRLD